MELLKAILILVIGFVLLIKGADFFVEGSSSVAKKFHVPAMLIGMTIVAMGTSLPECAVSVTASLANNNSLAVSNVVGGIAAQRQGRNGARECHRIEHFQSDGCLWRLRIIFSSDDPPGYTEEGISALYHLCGTDACTRLYRHDTRTH